MLEEGEGEEVDAEGGGRGEGVWLLVEQNAYKKRGCESCFVFMSWLAGAFDYFDIVSSLQQSTSHFLRRYNHRNVSTHYPVKDILSKEFR